MTEAEANDLLDALERERALKKQLESLTEAVEYLVTAAHPLESLAEKHCDNLMARVTKTMKVTDEDSIWLTMLFAARHGVLAAYAALRPTGDDSSVRKVARIMSGGLDIERPDLAEASFTELTKVVSFMAQHGVGPRGKK
jgi:hypothetical protein